jgi:hypothetical protein
MRHGFHNIACNTLRLHRVPPQSAQPSFSGRTRSGNDVGENLRWITVFQMERAGEPSNDSNQANESAEGSILRTKKTLRENGKFAKVKRKSRTSTYFLQI